jgi:hypothetical protein
MKQTGVSALVLVVSLMALTAQFSGQERSQSTVLTITPSECPTDVGIQASQSAPAHVVPVNNVQRTQPVQYLHITLKNSKSVDILEARIVVYGSTGKIQVLPANSAQPDLSDSEKTFNLALRVGAKNEASTDISLPGFTSISSVALNSLTFADHSIWHPANDKSCHVTTTTMIALR